MLSDEKRRAFQLHHTGIKTDSSKNCIVVSSLFQLHHTGIKTFECSRGTSFIVSFQLHHTGIKTDSSKNCIVVSSFISIAPYRN